MSNCAIWIAALLTLLLTGCTTLHRQTSTTGHPFRFPEDTFAYANELVWEYQIDPATGKTTSHRREPPPKYTLHCFVLARSADQFFRYAVFDPVPSKVSETEYRKLIRQVVSHDLREDNPAGEKVIIPGYADLRSFSLDHEATLKEECGGSWRSYLQRGNWRMVFPFSRSHQQQTAEQLKASIRDQMPPVVHVVRFPDLTINHAMLLYNFTEDDIGMQFLAYDPNDSSKPVTIRYDRASQTFSLSRNSYFAGGAVDLFQVYHRLFY